MDAFEARLQFVQVIKNLHKTLHKRRDTSPSSSSFQKSSNISDPVQFYQRHFEHHYEDFHQCFFETVQHMDSLDRLNVLIFWSRIIAALWPRCMKNTDGQWNISGKVTFEYLLLDLNKMLEFVLPPEDWKALTNLPVSIEILQFLLNLLKGDELETLKHDSTSLEELECSRESIISNFPSEIQEKILHKDFHFQWGCSSKSEDFNDSLRECLSILIDRRQKAVILQEMYRKHLFLALPSSSQLPTILHRMENDRERHKKSKEHNWFIDRAHMLDTTEFDGLWDDFSMGMTKNDYQNIKNLQEIAQSSYMYLKKVK